MKIGVICITYHELFNGYSKIDVIIEANVLGKS